MMDTRDLITACFAGAVLLAGTQATAGIIGLANGDFETSAANSNGNFPAPWYDSNLGWQDFRYAGLGSYTGTAAAFGSDNNTFQNGYIYQNVGTYGGELSITLDGTAYSRNRTAVNQVFGDMDVAFYYTSGVSFTPANGTDIAASGTLIGSVQEFEEGVNLPGLISGANGGTSSAFSHTALFGGSGISAGDEVWVRLGDGDNLLGGNTSTTLDEPFVDDLSVSAVVPEPGSLALLGLGGLLIARRRRA